METKNRLHFNTDTPDISLVGRIPRQICFYPIISPKNLPKSLQLDSYFVRATTQYYFEAHDIQTGNEFSTHRFIQELLTYENTVRKDWTPVFPLASSTVYDHLFLGYWRGWNSFIPPSLDQDGIQDECPSLFQCHPDPSTNLREEATPTSALAPTWRRRGKTVGARSLPKNSPGYQGEKPKAISPLWIIHVNLCVRAGVWWRYSGSVSCVHLQTSFSPALYDGFSFSCVVYGPSSTACTTVSYFQCYKLFPFSVSSLFIGFHRVSIFCCLPMFFLFSLYLSAFFSFLNFSRISLLCPRFTTSII